MHTTAMFNADLFFKVYINNYLSKYPNPDFTIGEIGSQNVNGSIRDIKPEAIKNYIGIDFIQANGVDVVLTDPYSLPFADNSLDCIISSSVFEHSEMFWLVFNEIMRVLKPEGLFYLNTPSNGFFHRYPVDCWRFYPDSGKALVTWAKRCGFNPCLVESYTSNKMNNECWNDFVAVFLKDANHIDKHTNRICHHFTNFQNGYIADKEGIIHNYAVVTEDQIATYSAMTE
ncbi:MAG: hypothetical protein RLZZ210_1248 [Pseudomonadota bacterium]|jgi:SAM-dependent methyltransferase